MVNSIKVSIIIPVYNTEKYLRECLDSVLQQNMKEIEVICVNDGSTDGSKAILEEYAINYNNVTIIEQENRGLSCARNEGIKKSKGEYVCFLDSDDLLEKGSLSELYEIAKRNQLEILCYDAICFYENEQLEKSEYKNDYYIRKKSYNQARTGKELFCDMIEADDYCDSACLLFINKAWLENEGISFMPGVIHEDCMFTFECFMRSCKIEHIKKQYLKYRIRPKSIMTTKATYASLRGRIYCYTNILRYLLNAELSDREKQAVAKLEKFIMYNIKWTDYKLDDKERANAINADVIEQLISACMDVGLERQYGISEKIYQCGFDDMLATYDKIILYGAGKIGRKIQRYINLKGYGDKIQCFAVSEKNVKEQCVDGLPVRRIFEIEEEESILVLVSARRDYQENMFNNALKCGFKNIELIDFRLEQIIDKYLCCS